MSEYVYLQGSEDVSRAGRSMASAAEDMRRAAETISEALRENQRHMDEWLNGFRDALESAKKEVSP